MPLKNEIEKFVGHKISDKDYLEIMQMAKDDIKFNKIGFGKKCSLDETRSIILRCYRVWERCK